MLNENGFSKKNKHTHEENRGRKKSVIEREKIGCAIKLAAFSCIWSVIKTISVLIYV